MKAVVLANDVWQYRWFLHEYGLNKEDYRYIRSWKDAKGVHKVPAIGLPGWFNGYSLAEAYDLHHEFKVKPWEEARRELKSVRERV